MYAVVRTGGKQYKVAPGDILEVEKLAGAVGDSVVLDDVLLVAGDDGIKIGQPNVEGASVTARITGQHRGEKILVFRYRPKKRVRVRRGHRQYLTRLQIHKISGDGFEYIEHAENEAAADESSNMLEEAAANAVESDLAVAALAESSSDAGVSNTEVDADSADDDDAADGGSPETEKKERE